MFISFVVSLVVFYHFLNQVVWLNEMINNGNVVRRLILAVRGILLAIVCDGLLSLRCGHCSLWSSLTFWRSTWSVVSVFESIQIIIAIRLNLIVHGIWLVTGVRLILQLISSAIMLRCPFFAHCLPSLLLGYYSHNDIHLSCHNRKGKNSN